MRDDTMTDTRPILERARSAMPGLTTVEAAITAVAERLRQARGAVRPEEAVVEVALGVVLDGGAVPDDLADRVLLIRHANESALATAQVLGPLERRLRERLTAVHREQADPALNVLAAELLELLTAARPVLARLDGVDDADTAITSSRVNEWKEAGHLATRYVAVRDAQRLIVAGALDPPDQARVTARVSPAIRSLVDDYGHIRQPDRHHATVGSGSNGEEVRLSGSRIFTDRIVVDSHVDRVARPRPWTTGDVLSDLRFVCRPDVSPWLPTVAELAAARDEHEQRKQAEARAAAERGPVDEPETFARAGRRMPPPPAALTQRLAEEELGIRDPL